MTKLGFKLTRNELFTNEQMNIELDKFSEFHGLHLFAFRVKIESEAIRAEFNALSEIRIFN